MIKDYFCYPKGWGGAAIIHTVDNSYKLAYIF
jgi:hypothetical protein